MNRLKLTPLLSNRLLLLLIALTFVRGLIYSALTIPWWQGHDEEFHFAQTRLLVDRLSTNPSQQSQNWPQEMTATFAAYPAGRWTTQPEGAVNPADVSTRHTTLKTPSLSYYLYAWPGLFLINQDLLTQLFVLRTVSTLLTCGIIFFAYLSARQIFPASAMSQLLVPWLILFNPFFMVTVSTVRDDNLAILLSTVIFYLLLIEVINNHIGWPSLLALVLTIPAFLAKPTTYFLLIVWGTLLLVYIWQFSRRYLLGIAVIGGAFIISLPLLWPRIQSDLKPFFQVKVTAEGLSYAFSTEYFWYTFSSFWIILGHVVHRLAPIWYVILLFLVLGAAAGLLIHTWRHIQKNGPLWDIEQKSIFLSLLFAATSITGLIVLAVLHPDRGSGRSTRYIFPVIAPLSMLLVTGWRALLPKTWRDIGLASLAAAFFLFDTMVWWVYALPWYYPFWPQ